VPNRDWSQIQRDAAQQLLDRHEPGTPLPPYNEEGSEILDRFIHCRQWLNRASGLIHPEQGYANLWLHYHQDDPEYLSILQQHNTTPPWDIFHVMYHIACGTFSDNGDRGPNPRVAAAIQGAEAEVSAGLESAYAYFKILWGQNKLLTSAVHEYDAIIADLHTGSSLF
jgi:hypothetical protein